MDKTPRNKIIAFLVLTFTLSAIWYMLIISSGSAQAGGGLYELLLMWSPGIAALVVQFWFTRGLGGLGWRPGKPRYLAAGYFLPLLYGLVMYAIIWLTGLGGFSPQQLSETIGQQIGYQSQSPVVFTVVYFFIAAVPLMIPGILSAVGEEIGWRGLLVPELAKVTTFTNAALISGVIWALWHMPLIPFGYSNGVAPWFAIICFAIGVIGMSFAFAWLRLRSGSLWPAVLLHAAHNVFIKNFFSPLTGNTGPTPYIYDEFGVGILLIGVVLAFYFWRRRGEVESRQQLERVAFGEGATLETADKRG